MTAFKNAPALLAGGLLLTALMLGCGSDDPKPGGSGGAGGGAGSGGTGGRGGAGGGSGGSAGNSGGSGGSAGTGGTAGGGAGGGTAGTGGSAGAGGRGGSAGSGGSGGRDGSTDMPSPADSGGGNANAYLDTCFAGLRARVGDHQTATKASADGNVRVRLALETGDGIGTSGTKPWRLIRFGLVVGNTQICIKDEAMLTGTYKTSLHNCMDTLELTVDGTVYRFEAPDTHPDRNRTTLRVLRGGSMVSGPTALPTVNCAARGAVCQSGQPC